MTSILASRRSTFIRYILFATMLCLLHGCGGGGSNLGDQDRVVGLLSTSAPIANSILSFYDTPDTSQDQQVGAAIVASAKANANGHFLSTRFPASNFRVVAAGGTLNGQPINGVLRAHVNNYQFGDVVHINLATTLVCAYFDATPGITLAEAETAVGNFLKVIGTNLGSAYVPQDSAVFNQTAFHQAANAYPDINTFIDSLVRDMKADAAATHAFTKQILNEAAPAASSRRAEVAKSVRLGVDLSAAIKLIAPELAKGALGAVGGIAVNKVLSYLGLGDTADYSAQFKKINERLDQLQSTVYDLENQVGAVDYDVLQASYNTVANPSVDLANKVVSYTKVLKVLASVTKADYDGVDSSGHAYKPYYDNLKNTLTASINNLAPPNSSNIKIHNMLVGTGGVTSLIKLASHKYSHPQRYYSEADQSQFVGLMEYWQSVQTALFNLLLVQLDAAGAPLSVKQSAVALYYGISADGTVPSTPTLNSQLGIQNALLPHTLPPGTFIDRTTGLMIGNILFTSLYNFPDPAIGPQCKSPGPESYVNALNSNSDTYTIPFVDQNGTRYDPGGRFIPFPRTGVTGWVSVPPSDIFSGWHGSSVADYAAKQGWPGSLTPTGGDGDWYTGTINGYYIGGQNLPLTFVCNIVYKTWAGEGGIFQGSSITPIALAVIPTRVLGSDPILGDAEKQSNYYYYETY